MPRIAPPRRIVRRPRQPRAEFVAGDPASGYYNDLRVELDAATPAEAAARLHELVSRGALVNHVTVAQLALAAWQRRGEGEGWDGVVREAAEWLGAQLDDDGGLPFRFAMPHTYAIAPPWRSAMAQGQAASLFVRAAGTLGEERFLGLGRRAVRPLLDGPSPLVATTPDGPVLQEYPTDPPAHVLNGWIFALWGLYDVGVACGDEKATAAFSAGIETLRRRLPLYEVGGGWSRYDLYPHRLVHVASPFYHRLHVAQLDATADLAGEEAFRQTARRWEAAAGRPVVLGAAVARKLAFRVLSPRRAPA